MCSVESFDVMANTLFTRCGKLKSCGTNPYGHNYVSLEGYSFAVTNQYITGYKICNRLLVWYENYLVETFEYIFS